MHSNLLSVSEMDFIVQIVVIIFNNVNNIRLPYNEHTLEFFLNEIVSYEKCCALVLQVEMYIHVSTDVESNYMHKFDQNSDYS